MSNFNIDIEKQLSKLGKDIQTFVEKMVPVQSEPGDFRPECDIVESSDTYMLYMDLPGMQKKQIVVTLNEGVLSVSGERELYLKDDEELKRSERKQGSFSRSFALPGNADSSSVKASFKQGVLTVKISKSGVESEDQTQSIPVD